MPCRSGKMTAGDKEIVVHCIEGERSDDALPSLSQDVEYCIHVQCSENERKVPKRDHWTGLQHASRPPTASDVHPVIRTGTAGSNCRP